MTTLRIASSTLRSAILFAECKDFVSAYKAVFKPSHDLRGSTWLIWPFPLFCFHCAFENLLNTHWHFGYFSFCVALKCDCAEEAAHSAIAVAAAAVVASERSPKGSPCSCLACSDGIPGSVPSDCRLAPLPPSLTHTHKPAPSIVAPSSSSLQYMWGSSAIYISTVHLAHVGSPSSPSRLNFQQILHLLLLGCPWALPVFFFFSHCLPLSAEWVSGFKRDTML